LPSLRQRLIVRALQLHVAPLDIGLRAKLVEVLLHRRAALALDDATTDVVLRLFERAALPFRPRFELEDLISPRGANGVCQLADLQFAQELLKLRGQFVEVNWPDQAAVRLRRRRGLLSRQAGERLALQQALPNVLGLG